MKLWELHAQQLDGAIRTTPDGEAEIDGLVLTEKAYILVMRAFRPVQLVGMVSREGAAGAADKLIEHFGTQDALQLSGGRGLMLTRATVGGLGLARDDERVAHELLGRRG
jgi:hypothetical protein